MSATSGGGRGRGRGTGKEMGSEGPIGMGRGKGRPNTTPPSPAPFSVPPDVEEKVRAEKEEMKGTVIYVSLLFDFYKCKIRIRKAAAC